jgi:radical SAM protein with 4Fe4S-binding SPASM domain
MAPHPEIADIEVTTICAGVGGKLCGHCYKSNTRSGSNMSLDTYKRVFDRIAASGTLTQVAFGADSTGRANPDLIEMMKYTRSKGVVPNITIADIDDDMAQQLASVCGAVAVSRYADKNYCYDSVARLSAAGLKQINIHLMISRETFDWAYETIKDVHSDPRLKGLKAVILLSLKQKGRGTRYNTLVQSQFAKLVRESVDYNVQIGFDSCSSLKFLRTLKKNHPDYPRIKQQVEPCESTLFSVFVNHKGETFPCSFTEGTPNWESGIDTLAYDDFNDVWNHTRMQDFRAKLLASDKNEHECRECTLFNV